MDEKNRLRGYLDISDVLRVMDTKSNVTIKGFVREAAQAAPDTPLAETGIAIMNARTNSAAVVNEDGVYQGGGVLFSELFPRPDLAPHHPRQSRTPCRENPSPARRTSPYTASTA
ncbi:hypothetical protein [Methanoculleus chikugoensis]|uniref:hypothetical protein n=1 Tax=Methanoculleus chikugoensis TaxID=118126 RepID=UPI000B088484|nr:hypothetical protein [Methanoculleus chikugoensis]